MQLETDEDVVSFFFSKLCKTCIKKNEEKHLNTLKTFQINFKSQHKNVTKFYKSKKCHQNINLLDPINLTVLP